MPTAENGGTDLPRLDGSWGFLTSLLSLIVIGTHHLWWDVGLTDDLVAEWADCSTEILAAGETIATVTATAVILQVAAVLVVVVPIVALYLRRLPW